MSLPPVLPAYRDRKTGLTIFGLVTILIGVIFALFVPLMLVGMSMAPQPGQDLRTVLPAVVVYSGMAIVFVWLGIGSVLARRWARALLLIIAWSWLLIGLLSTGVIMFAMPKMLASARAAGQPGLSAETDSIITGVTAGFMLVMMVIVPGLYLLFYRSPHVKATCEAHDPVVRWTDRAPLPVIGVSCWLVFSAPMMLMMAFMHKTVLPFFGRFLVGPGAALLYLALTALWLFAAWAIYRLRIVGWWVALLSFALFGLSSFLTYTRHDLTELYRLMEYPPDQIAAIERANVFSGTALGWLTLGSVIPLLGYLLWVRKYFRPESRVNA